MHGTVSPFTKCFSNLNTLDIVWLLYQLRSSNASPGPYDWNSRALQKRSSRWALCKTLLWPCRDCCPADFTTRSLRGPATHCRGISPFQAQVYISQTIEQIFLYLIPFFSLDSKLSIDINFTKIRSLKARKINKTFRSFRSSAIVPYSSNIGFLIYRKLDSNSDSDMPDMLLQISVNEHLVNIPGNNSFCIFFTKDLRIRGFQPYFDLKFYWSM